MADDDSASLHDALTAQIGALDDIVTGLREVSEHLLSVRNRLAGLDSSSDIQRMIERRNDGLV